MGSNLKDNNIKITMHLRKEKGVLRWWKVWN